MEAEESGTMSLLQLSSPNGTKLESCYPTRVEGAGAGGGGPRAMGATGDRPGVGTRRATRQAPGTAAGAARGAAGSGNSDTDVTADKQHWSTPGTTQLAPASAAGNRAITGPESADTRRWTAAEETHADGTLAGTSSGGPRGMGTAVGKPGAGAQIAARPAPGTAAGAARDKDVVSDKQRGSTLDTTQLVPAAAAENRAITGPASADTWIGTAAEEAEQQKRRASGARVTDAPCVGVDRHQELCIRIQ